MFTSSKSAKIYLSALLLTLLFWGTGAADRLGVLISEPDGNPADSYVYKISLPNGTTSIANNVLTYTPSVGSFASDAETLAGVLTTKATTPANIQAKLKAISSFGLDQNVETLSGTKTLLISDLPVQKLDPNGADRDVNLPAEASSTDLVFLIFNQANGAGEDLVIKDDTPTTLATIGPENVAICSCDGTTWTVRIMLPADALQVDGVSGAVSMGTTAAGANQIVYATLGADLSPAYSGASGVNWTLGAGWETPIAGSVLNKNAAGVGTATPTAATQIVSGTTYKVVVVSTVTASYATFTMGGITAPSISASTTYTWYITAVSTANVVITPHTDFRGTLVISWQALTDATGDQTVYGNLKLGSGLQDPAGTNVLVPVPGGSAQIPGSLTLGDTFSAGKKLYISSASDVSQYITFKTSGSLANNVLSLEQGNSEAMDLVAFGAGGSSNIFGMPRARSSVIECKLTNGLFLGTQTNSDINVATYDVVKWRFGKAGEFMQFPLYTHGGYSRKIYPASVDITAAATATLDLNIPSGWIVKACQLHVKTALAAGETWDAELNDGGTEEAITSAAAVAQNTNVNHFAHADAGYGGTLTDAETDIVITKNGGGDFTAQGTIEGHCLCEGFDAWDNEP